MARKTLLIVAVLTVVVVVPVVALLLFDWSAVKGFVVEKASKASGRNVAIDGDISVDWSLKPRITVEGIRLENAPWGSAENMVTLDRLRFRIDLLELLRFRLELPELSLKKPVIILEKSDSGEVNWKFGGEPAAGAVVEVTVPEERAEFPVIGVLTVDDGTLIYRDPAKGIDIEMKVTEALAEGQEGESRVTLKGDGHFENEPFSVNLEAGSLNKLRNEDEPYPVDLSVSIGETKMSANGTVDRPLNVAGVDLSLSIDGKSMADLFPIFGIPLPPTEPYALEGHLSQRDAVWDFTEMNGTMGDSDLGGEVKVDPEGERPRFFATLTSRKLDFDDLAPLIGAEPKDQSPQAEASEDKQRVLPDAPIDLTRLRAMDMRVVFDGQEILAPGLPIDNLHFTAELADGRLMLDPISFGVSGGEVGGKVMLDGRQETPRAEANIDIQRVQLKPFLERSEFFDASDGLIGGRFELVGEGGSIAEVLAGGNGRFALVMTGGTLSALAIEGAGLDIGEILAVTVTEDEAIPIRCVVADLPVTEGIANVKTMVVDTTDSAITGDGSINLAEETFDIEILAHPKDASVLSARTPLRIGGTFADPSFGVNPSGLVARAAAAAALGIALTPVAALIPFIELGLGEDSDCAGLIEQARKFTE